MTMQGLPERRPKKIDLNLLPPEYLPKKASRLTIGLVIAVVILVCVAGLFLGVKQSPASENETLTSQRNSLQTELQQKTTLANQCKQIQDDIDLCNAQLASLEGDYDSFLNLTYPWSVIMEDVQKTPKGAGGTLGDISQSGYTISVGGEFIKEKFIYEYAVLLNETAHFSQVTINSISKSGEEGEEVYSFDIQAVLKVGGEE